MTDFDPQADLPITGALIDRIQLAVYDPGQPAEVERWLAITEALSRLEYLIRFGSERGELGGDGIGDQLG